jgi:hypothetical protein
MSKTSLLIPNLVYKPLPIPPSLYITMKTRFAHILGLPGIMNFHEQDRICHAERSEASLCPSRQTLPLRKLRASAHCAQGDNPFPILLVKVHNTILSLLLAFMLAACSFNGIYASPATIQHSNEQLTPVTPGIQLGEQPCPALLKNPAYWTTVVNLRIGQTIESVICGNLVGIPVLQAVVAVRHTGDARVLDIAVYNNIFSSTPVQLFALHGLLHGDVKISGYNTLLTAQSDPHSILNNSLSPPQYEQDLFREFKWSDRARTLVQVAFSGIFPDLTRYQAELEQSLVNQGKGYQQWRLDVVQSARVFASTFLNWPPRVPVAVLSGGGLHDYKALVQVRNTAHGGGIVRISFTRLEGNNNGGLWEATSIEADGVSITSPKSGQQTTSPLMVAGTSKALTGKLTKITVLDHNHADIGLGRVIKAGTNKTMTFSSSVPYTSSFLDGAQEGILALYVYNTRGAIITVAMVKVLLT